LLKTARAASALPVYLGFSMNAYKIGNSRNTLTFMLFYVVKRKQGATIQKLCPIHRGVESISAPCEQLTA
jgi:hypothetical protein